MRVIRQAVSGGSTLADAFEISGKFPYLVVQLIRINENAGDVNPALDRLSEYYSDEVNEVVSAATASIKPAMLLIVGLMLGWVVMAVFGPMYQNVGSALSKM